MNTENDRNKRKVLVCDPIHFDSARSYVTDFIISECNLTPNARFLDLGCGVLRVGLPIIDYLNVGNFYGYDLCPYRIDEAKKELQEFGDPSKRPILTSDWSEITGRFNNRKFDFVWSYQVLIHVPDDELFKIIDRIKQALADDGVALVSVNTNTKQFPKDLRWREYPFVVRPLDFYKEAFDRVNLDFEMNSKWQPTNGERILKVWHN